MNILLLNQNDLVAADKAVIYQHDRRFKHLQAVLKKESGAKVKVGELGGKIGVAKIIQANDERFDLQFELNCNPPAPLAAKLILALPRPKVVLRALQSATTLGVKEIYLVNAYRVEKAFWSCEQLKPESIKKALHLGLEQARDTILPNVSLERRLKPFVEDHLDEICGRDNRILAHPSDESQRFSAGRGNHVVVIGPEGGFIDYEIGMFKSLKFEVVNLGERILKSETAMISLLSQIQTFS